MNGQRALWTFLILTLAGPFLAGILAAIYTPLAIWANIAPFTAGDHPHFDLSNLPDAAGLTQLIGQASVRAFVWTPFAAAFAALGCIGLLFTRGEVGWAMAGVMGVLGFFLAYVAAPFAAGDLLPAFAVIAGIVTAGLITFLVRIGVLPSPAEQ